MPLPQCTRCREILPDDAIEQALRYYEEYSGKMPADEIRTTAKSMLLKAYLQASSQPQSSMASLLEMDPESCRQQRKQAQYELQEAEECLENLLAELREITSELRNSGRLVTRLQEEGNNQGASEQANIYRDLQEDKYGLNKQIGIQDRHVQEMAGKVQYWQGEEQYAREREYRRAAAANAAHEEQRRRDEEQQRVREEEKQQKIREEEKKQKIREEEKKKKEAEREEKEAEREKLMDAIRRDHFDRLDRAHARGEYTGFYF